MNSIRKLRLLSQCSDRYLKLTFNFTEEDCIKIIMFSEQRDSKGEDSGELEENSESEGEAADDDGSDMIEAT